MSPISENHVLDRPFSIILSYAAEASCWTAHCLEFDIIEEGKSPKEALIHLFKIMKANVKDAIKHDTLRDLFQFAPKEYWLQALAAQPVSLDKIVPPREIAHYFIPPQKLDIKLIPHRA